MNTRPGVPASGSATHALRWLSREGRSGDGRVDRIVQQAHRAGRLRLALLAEELATAVAARSADGAARPAGRRATAEIVEEIEIFCKRLGMTSPRGLSKADARQLRAACEALVDELIEAEGESSRLVVLRAHVALCGGRRAEAARLLDGVGMRGVISRWAGGVRGALGR